MTTPTIDLIHRHGSMRQFTPGPVPSEMIEAVVLAALRASTSSNLHLVSVIAVTDAGKRKRLSEISKQEHVAQAAVVLVWCADLKRLDRVCELRGHTQVTAYVENFLTCAVDVGIAAQNAALAAESLGLGICYLGSIRNNTQTVIELLQLPRLVFPLVGMALGRPAAPAPIRPRLPLPAVLSWNSYPAEAPDALLKEYDRTMIATGIYEGRQIPVPGRPDTMEDYGWMEHSARRASQTLRVEIREVLKRQGFALE